MKAPRIKPEFWALGGGLDLQSPALRVKPGFARDAYNIEGDLNGGYARTIGYDRFDGNRIPSEATFWTVELEQPLTADCEGMTMQWCGNEGVLLYVDTDNPTVIAYYSLSETQPLKGENIELVGSSQSMTALEDAHDWGLTQAEHDAIARARARDYVSQFVTPVPGIGPVRGVIELPGKLFAFRDQSETEGGLFVSSNTGWQRVMMGELLTINYGYGLDDGDITLNAGGKTYECVPQLGADITSGRLWLKSHDLVEGDVLCGEKTESHVIGTHGAFARNGNLSQVEIQSLPETGEIEKEIAHGWYYKTQHYYPLESLNTHEKVISVEAEKAKLSGGDISGLPADIKEYRVNDEVVLVSPANSGSYIVSSISDGSLSVKNTDGSDVTFSEETDVVIKISGVCVRHVLTVSNKNIDEIETSGELVCLTAYCEVTDIEPCRIQPGGRYQAVVHNFYAGSDSKYAYGVSGIDEAFELRPDGCYIPIKTGVNSYPSIIEVHHNHLFVAFPGGTYQCSRVGYPLNWSAILGAAEFGAGDDITALQSMPGGVLVIGCRNKTVALYGTVKEEWQQKTIAESVGMQANTLQPLFVPVAWSERGLVRLDRVEAFGDFALNALDPKRRVEKLMRKLPYHCSTQVSRRNQYRLFGPDGKCFCITLDDKGNPAITTIGYPIPVNDIWRYDNNSEHHYFVSGDDGFIYRLDDICNSFDGDDIDWSLKLVYNHSRAPSIIKSYKYAEVELNADGWLTFNTSYQLDYGDPSTPSSNTTLSDIFGGGGSWNIDAWNEFFWSTEDISTPRIDLSGHGKNLSLHFYGQSAHEASFSMQGIVLHMIYRRYQRV